MSNERNISRIGQPLVETPSTLILDDSLVSDAEQENRREHATSMVDHGPPPPGIESGPTLPIVTPTKPDFPLWSGRSYSTTPER